MIRIETDNTVKDGCRVRQLRACLKGRDMRERLYTEVSGKQLSTKVESFIVTC